MPWKHKNSGQRVRLKTHNRPPKILLHAWRSFYKYKTIFNEFLILSATQTQTHVNFKSVVNVSKGPGSGRWSLITGHGIFWIEYIKMASFLRLIYKKPSQPTPHQLAVPRWPIWPTALQWRSTPVFFFFFLLPTSL